MSEQTNEPKPPADDLLIAYMEDVHKDLKAKAAELLAAVERADTPEKKITLARLLGQFGKKVEEAMGFRLKAYTAAVLTIGEWFGKLTTETDAAHAKLMVEITAALEKMPEGEELRDEFGHLAFWKASPPKIEITDLAALPRNFFVPDLKRIKAALDAKLDVPGVKVTPQRKAIVK